MVAATRYSMPPTNENWTVNLFLFGFSNVMSKAEWWEAGKSYAIQNVYLVAFILESSIKVPSYESIAELPYTLHAYANNGIFSAYFGSWFWFYFLLFVIFSFAFLFVCPTQFIFIAFADQKFFRLLILCVFLYPFFTFPCDLSHSLLFNEHVLSLS